MAGGLGRNALQSADEQEKREGTAKVTRYRAGQVPNWAGDEEEDEGLLKGRDRGQRGEADEGDDAVEATPVIIAPGNDRRLQRLAGRSKAAGASASGRRRERQTETETETETRKGKGANDLDVEEDEDEVKIRERRARIRSAQLEAEERQRQGLGASSAPAGEKSALRKNEEEGEEEEESDEYDSSEYETDTSDDENDTLKLAKPVFVSKKDRATIKGGDGDPSGGNSMIQTTWKSTDEVLKRQQETREILKQMAVNEFKGDTDGKAFDDVDTDDEKDKADQYEAWKRRELERLRLEWQAANGVTDISEEDLQVKQQQQGDGNGDGGRQDRAFMQKYYHQGAFFQAVSDHKLASGGVDDVYKKDYASAPTGEDRFNKAALPEVMQVRNFGKRGRTKWTHLSKEDTSRLGDDYRNDKRRRNNEHRNN